MSTEAIYVKVFLNELKQVRRWKVNYDELMEKLMRIMGTSDIEVEYMDNDLEWIILETNDEWKVASSQHIVSEAKSIHMHACHANKDRCVVKGHDWFSEKLYVHEDLHAKSKNAGKASKGAEETLLKPLILRAKTRKMRKGSLVAEKRTHLGNHAQGNSTSCAPQQKNAATSAVAKNDARNVWFKHHCKRIPIESIVNQARSIIIDGSDEAQYVPVVSGKTSGRKINITQCGDEKVEMTVGASASTGGKVEPMSSKVQITVQDVQDAAKEAEENTIANDKKVEEKAVASQIHTFEDLNETSEEVEVEKVNEYRVCESYILEDLEPSSHKRDNFLPEEAILQSMGFTDKRLNLHLLKHHKGKIDKVVNNLLQLGN